MIAVALSSFPIALATFSLENGLSSGTPFVSSHDDFSPPEISPQPPGVHLDSSNCTCPALWSSSDLSLPEALSALQALRSSRPLASGDLYPLQVSSLSSILSDVRDYTQHRRPAGHGRSPASLQQNTSIVSLYPKMPANIRTTWPDTVSVPGQQQNYHQQFRLKLLYPYIQHSLLLEYQTTVRS